MAAGQPLRVLAAIPFASAQGGAERTLVAFAAHAMEVGVDLEVVLPAEGSLADGLAARGVATHVVELGRFRDLRAGRATVQRLRGLLRARSPDVVASWLPRTHVYLSAAAAAEGLQRRLVWWRHTIASDGLDRFATALPTSAVLCCSESAASAQRAIRPRRLAVAAHPGIEGPRAAEKPAVDALRAQLGIPDDRFVIGLPGRLVRWKGALRFLDAVALLRARDLDVHALIVGGAAHGLEPEFADEARDHARRLGLTGRATFTGHVDDPIPFLQLMDTLVNASAAEPFGLTILEGMALGVPVLAMDAGGPAEIIEHRRSGLLVSDGSPQRIAEGLLELVRDEALRDTVVRGGRARYQERFTARAFADRLRDCFDEVPLGHG